MTLTLLTMSLVLGGPWPTSWTSHERMFPGDTPPDAGSASTCWACVERAGVLTRRAATAIRTCARSRGRAFLGQAERRFRG